MNIDNELKLVAIWRGGEFEVQIPGWKSSQYGAFQDLLEEFRNDIEEKFDCYLDIDADGDNNVLLAAVDNNSDLENDEETLKEIVNQIERNLKLQPFA